MASLPVEMDLPASGSPLGTREIPPEISEGLSPERRALARRCLTALAILASFGMLGTASSLYLATHYPLLLIAMSPIGRHLVLVAPQVDPLAFVVVAVGRRMLFYTASFHLGRALGPAGIVWIESRTERIGRWVRWLERLFGRWSHGVVFAMAGPTIATLAGISGMRARVFAALAASGLVVRMVLLIAFAEYFRGPIETALVFVERHWVPGTVLIVAAIALYQWRVHARARARDAAGETAGGA